MEGKMRTAIIVVLALVAVVCAGVWALGQFGGAMTNSAALESGEPIVREAQDPQAPASAEQTLESAAAEQDVSPPSSAPAPAAAPAPEASEPAAEAAKETAGEAEEPGVADQALRALRSIPAPPADEQMRPRIAESGAPPSPATEAPAAPVEEAEPVAPTPAPAPEQRVQTANAPAAATGSSLEAEFKSRKVTYNRPPEKLILDRAIDVSLVINATDDEDAGTDALQGFPGTVVERDVELSDTVSAQLTGVGFDIVSQTVERQRLSGKTINRWQWRVTPTEKGTRTLILEIFGYASGSLDAEPLDAYRDEITVEVEQLGELIKWAQSVQPIFAVLAALAGAASALFAFLRFQAEKKNKKAAGTDAAS
jgi:hypothetical protein